ncbi:MAG: DUF3416 domain-containing protein [Candidatus Eremiobacteraeota bacterium]|nr:DUF3416 domain-containing protein [Candidatus Eremiobacteraeota bacterium]MBC5802787.1 DUF3416 domain-containing protein [Candidatus Eremiobacteraeota bacterium]MBC5820550.1 DUF3416 domain-containing protein [Candidatus Eremiobacteraeota bacterium]
MGPRIYNLFPTLAGPVARWAGHLERIAAMRFDWVYVNPFHVTGGSGSLYSVVDYRRLNPVLRGDDRADDDAILRGFLSAARERELSVMMDLVINHTADDGPLVQQHPDWYRHDDGGTIVAPSAVDPDDLTKVTVWGDLAELDYRERPERAELVAYFADVARHYAQLGMCGFRCDAAYQVPAAVWSEIIAAVRAVRPDAFFAAETLGCTPDQISALRGVGFDALFNSSKWWDFQSAWLLDQYEASRHIAPSIAFPESHDTPRLSAELSQSFPGIAKRQTEAAYRFRYLFAAIFSSGVMMPMGYEYGFSKRLDVVNTRPHDWEQPRFDLTEFIAATNALKGSLPALGEEGAQHLLHFGAGAPLGLLRDGTAADGGVLSLVNAGARMSADIDGADILRTLGHPAREVTPGVVPRAVAAQDDVTVAPLTIRVFAAQTVSPHDTPQSQQPRPTAQDAVAAAKPAIVENVRPQLDGGRHPIKRVVGDFVDVTADVFRDGHDALAAALLYRERGTPTWREAPFRFLDDDAWGGSFPVTRNARYEYTVEAWPDVFGSWQGDVRKKRAAAQPIALDLAEGRALVESARERAQGGARRRIDDLLRGLDAVGDEVAYADLLLAEDAATALRRVPDRSRATRYAPPLEVVCDRDAARFGAWYELFVRSQGTTPGAGGTFADATQRLPAIRAMGFDVVYLAPIHPIGRAFRKGRNNAPQAEPNDPGSPWAIGNEHGGHTAVAPELGTLDDFARFVAAARANNLEVALDYALQCSPDHPYVAAHPEWFEIRADSSIKHAENPPKKYEDIVNFNWYGPHAAALWIELRDVVLFWIQRGVTIFRVDNPHTKPFAFWSWMIADVQSRRPDVIFLAEAFTRPKVMKELAKLGFTQSYTYFTWRNAKAELTAYVEELVNTEMADYYRPNFFANTPDILPPYLQTGGRPAFIIRLVLAATLSSLYGLYSGFELCENGALAGREEYADSEKYEIRVRDWNAPGNIIEEIRRVNRIRRENPALHDWRNVRFYRADHEAVIFYGKRRDDSTILVAVNLDPFAVHETTLWFPTGELGLGDGDPYEVEELLGAAAAAAQRRGSAHGVRLDPARNPAVIYRLRLTRAR